jgi:hypothetical protein
MSNIVTGRQLRAARILIEICETEVDVLIRKGMLKTDARSTGMALFAMGMA